MYACNPNFGTRKAFYTDRRTKCNVTQYIPGDETAVAAILGDVVVVDVVDADGDVDAKAAEAAAAWATACAWAAAAAAYIKTNL